MRTSSPFSMGVIYSIMGIIFTYIAVETSTDTIWNFTTILLMLVATFDFGVSLRMFSLHRKLRKLTRK